MTRTTARTWTAATALTALLLTGASGANAEDFLSALFGAFNGGSGASRAPEPVASMPFASEGEFGAPVAPRAPRPASSVSGGGAQAYCVRTCDGRYFPISGSDRQSRAASCNSFCPASDTKVFYGGSTIDNATAEGGKSYSELPNAFRYRNEIVDNCTCNGKDHFGLAKVDVEHDPTVRKGDIVAGADGLMVAGRAGDRRQGSLDLSPASASIRTRYERMPVVASQ